MTKAKINSDPAALQLMRSVMPVEHQGAFDVLTIIYGNSTEKMINGLMDMTIRAAILGGVTAENFAKGMKAHWDFFAAQINRMEQ